MLLHWCSGIQNSDHVIIVYMYAPTRINRHQQKCHHPSLQELNTKPDNVILTSMYPRNELVPELDSQSMAQLQLVPSGVVIVRVKTVRSLPFYPHSWAFPAFTFWLLNKQSKHGGPNIPCKMVLLCVSSQLLVLNIVRSLPHTQCMNWYCTYHSIYMYVRWTMQLEITDKCNKFCSSD